MIYNHRDYLKYELPTNWCAEETDDNLLIYEPNGNGAMTISFFNMLDSAKTAEEQISIMAKQCADQNEITLHAPFILQSAKGAKVSLCGEGTTADGWFIKLWVIAKRPKIVFATYESPKSSTEIKKCDAIINSMEFTF